MTSNNGVTLEGDDITKILSKLEAKLTSKNEDGDDKKLGKASPEPGWKEGSPGGSPRKFTTFTTQLRPSAQVRFLPRVGSHHGVRS